MFGTGFPWKETRSRILSSNHIVLPPRIRTGADRLSDVCTLLNRMGLIVTRKIAELCERAAACRLLVV